MRKLLWGVSTQEAYNEIVSGTGLCGVACLRHDILRATAASEVATAVVQHSFPSELQVEDVACTVPFLLDPVHVLFN